MRVSVVEQRVVEDEAADGRDAAVLEDLGPLAEDADGVAVHSNVWSLLGRRYPGAFDREARGKPPAVEQKTLPGGEPILEVRTPLSISTRFWGSLAMGFTLAPVEEEARVNAALELGYQKAPERTLSEAVTLARRLSC